MIPMNSAFTTSLRRLGPSERIRSGCVHAAAVVVAMAVLTGCPGCGRGDGRTQVSGTVTWKNEPVKRGMIMIEPDGTQGNRGPQSVSEIADGTFRTRATHGSVSGPVVIEVVGYGELGKGEFPPPLFPPYAFKTEIPKGKATLQIVVPDEPPARSRAR